MNISKDRVISFLLLKTERFYVFNVVNSINGKDVEVSNVKNFNSVILKPTHIPKKHIEPIDKDFLLTLDTELLEKFLEDFEEVSKPKRLVILKPIYCSQNVVSPKLEIRFRRGYITECVITGLYAEIFFEEESYEDLYLVGIYELIEERQQQIQEQREQPISYISRKNVFFGKGIWSLDAVERFYTLYPIDVLSDIPSAFTSIAIEGIYTFKDVLEYKSPCRHYQVEELSKEDYIISVFSEK